MFSIHRWTKERVKRETERVIWSSSGHWGWRRSELEARTFLFGSTLRWLQWSVHEIKVLIIFHQVRECWIIAYNTSPNINIVPLINFSQVTTACFQQSIFVISVFVPDDIFQLRWWPDDPPLIQQEHCARWSIIPQSSWAHMASIIPSSAKGTHLFPIKSCKSIIKHHQGTNTLPC